MASINTLHEDIARHLWIEKNDLLLPTNLEDLPRELHYLRNNIAGQVQFVIQAFDKSFKEATLANFHWKNSKKYLFRDGNWDEKFIMDIIKKLGRSAGINITLWYLLSLIGRYDTFEISPWIVLKFEGNSISIVVLDTETSEII